MAILLFNNNAKSTLAAPISAGATSIDLTPGTGTLFPNPGPNEYFKATIVDLAQGVDNEIVNVTAVSGDTMTVVRAQEGTSARNWNAGDFFNNFMTAGTMSAMLQQGQSQSQSTNYGVDTGVADAILVSLNPAPSALSGINGAPVRVLILATNATTSPTINVNSLGAVAISLRTSTGYASVGIGTIAAGKVCEFVYDGTRFQYNGVIEGATKAQIQAATAGVMPVTPAGLAAAYPGAADAGVNGGHVYLPGGYLLQWGNYNSVGTSPITINFLTAFSSAPRVVCTATQSSGALPGTPTVMSMSSILTSGFTVYASLWNGSTFINNTGTSFHWHAIGPAPLP